MLFYTMIDLNSEDVMYKLILSHLIPCKHLMKSQIITLKQSSHEINGANAKTFLSLASLFTCTNDTSNQNSNNSNKTNDENSNNKILNVNLMNLNESTPLYKWLSNSFDDTELQTIFSYLENMRFNFVDYLKDAKIGILYTTQKTRKWSCNYDVNSSQLNELNSNSTNELLDLSNNGHNVSHNNSSATNNTTNNEKFNVGTNNLPAHELDYDPEEFLINLNIASSSLNDPNKSLRSTSNLFSSKEIEHEILGDFDDSLNDTNETIDKINNSSIRLIKSNKNKSDNKKSRKSTKHNSCTIKNSTILEDVNENIERLNKKLNKTKEEKTKRRSRRAAGASNDFYILSFDNELSETSQSESSDSEEFSESSESITNKKEVIDHHEDEEEDEEDSDYLEEDDDLSDTSFSSSHTLNNNDSTTSSSNKNEQKLLESRQKLVEYLFSNEDESKQYLSTNLNNFLNALDNLFNDSLQIQSNSMKNENGKIDILCDQIMNIYNELFMVQTLTQSSPSNNENKLTRNTRSDSIIDQNSNIINNKDDLLEEQSVSSNNQLNTFPTTYTSTTEPTINSSSSSFSLNTNSTQTNNIISSIEITDSNSSKENDIGPFLCALLNRLDHMLNNSMQINFLITGLFARLVYYPQLLLRSYLLNHNLVMKSNIKSLIQVLTNVKLKIDACSKSYDNFELLYLKAKLSLVKRLIDSKKIHNNKQLEFNQQQQAPDQNNVSLDQSNNSSFNSNSNNNSVINKKKSTLDKLLSVFFKSNDSNTNSQTNDNNLVSSKSSNSSSFPSKNSDFINGSPNTPRSNTNSFNHVLNTPQVEIDLSDVKTKYFYSLNYFSFIKFKNQLF
jgi:hypothetical protein